MSLSPEAVVCVVEDNEDNLFVIASLIREKIAPSACHEFASGRQLLAWLTAHPAQRVDLLLLEIQIPHEDGYAVLSQIRGYLQLRETPVMALTRWPDIERLKQASFAGFISILNMGLFEDQPRRAMSGEFVEGP